MSGIVQPQPSVTVVEVINNIPSVIAANSGPTEVISVGTPGPPGPGTPLRMGTLAIDSPTDVTKTLIAYSVYTFTITELYALQTTDGTIDVTMQINGVDVTGLTAITATSTPQNVPATGANLVTVGDSVTVVLSGNAGSQDLKFTMGGTILNS